MILKISDAVHNCEGYINTESVAFMDDQAHEITLNGGKVLRMGASKYQEIQGLILDEIEEQKKEKEDEKKAKAGKAAPSSQEKEALEAVKALSSQFAKLNGLLSKATTKTAPAVPTNNQVPRPQAKRGIFPRFFR